MVNHERLEQAIWYLLHGDEFRMYNYIREGLSFSNTIPKSFWNRFDYSILDLKITTKNQLKALQNKLIERIIKEICEPLDKENMYSDNYSRLFHALAILNIPKNDQRLPPIGYDYMYNIAYKLWAFDDGSEKIYEYISSVSWYSAEAVKNDEVTKKYLLTGMRHDFVSL